MLPLPLLEPRPDPVDEHALMRDLECVAVAAGASFGSGQQLTALAREDDHWLLTLSDVHAPVRADVVLGCDGIRSAVRPSVVRTQRVLVSGTGPRTAG